LAEVDPLDTLYSGVSLDQMSASELAAVGVTPMCSTWTS
jgi:hypothetical protein